jgi:hypothetical protein
MVIVLDPTLTTFAKTGSDNEESLYEIKLSSLTIFPGNKILGLVIVLIPPVAVPPIEMVAIPTLNFND